MLVTLFAGLKLLSAFESFLICMFVSSDAICTPLSFSIPSSASFSGSVDIYSRTSGYRIFFFVCVRCIGVDILSSVEGKEVKKKFIFRKYW